MHRKVYMPLLLTYIFANIDFVKCNDTYIIFANLSAVFIIPNLWDVVKVTLGQNNIYCKK